MALSFTVSLTLLAAWVIPISSFSPYLVAAAWPYILAYSNLIVPLIALFYYAFPTTSMTYLTMRLSYGIVLLCLIGKAQLVVLFDEPTNLSQCITWLATTIYVVNKMQQETQAARLARFRRHLSTDSFLDTIWAKAWHAIVCIPVTLSLGFMLPIASTPSNESVDWLMLMTLVVFALSMWMMQNDLFTAKVNMVAHIYTSTLRDSPFHLSMSPTFTSSRFSSEQFECLLASILSLFGYLTTHSSMCFLLLAERIITLFATTWYEERFLSTKRSFGWNATAATSVV